MIKKELLQLVIGKTGKDYNQISGTIFESCLVNILK